MRFVTMKAGENVNALAERLSKGRTKAEISKTANALKQANPSLAGRVKKASRDTILIVPEELDVKFPRAAATEQMIARDLVSRSKLRIGDVAKVVPELAKRSEEEAALAVTRLDSAEVKRVAREQPELRERLPGLKKRAQERLARAQEATKLQAEGLEAMDKDLQALAKLVAGQPGLGSLLGELGVGGGTGSKKAK